MATTPTINPSNADSSTAGGHFLIPHKHNFNSIVGLRFGTNGRVEPVYDSGNVYANGVVIALYNAATTLGSFSAPTVPRVTVTSAVQNVEGDDANTEGKVEADRFLAEGRITPDEHRTITTTPTPQTEGVKPGTVIAGRENNTVISGITFETVLTPNGTTLAQLIKNVTFPRTLAQLNEHSSSVPNANAVVNNLAALALNVIEPIKAKYPNALITNSYRQGLTSSSQHNTGQACDLQFRGVAAHDYYNIAVWISKNISYDQLLLEYLPSKTVWIHISYAIPNLPYGGRSVRKSKGIASTLATLNGAAGGKFTPNLHADIIQAAIINKVVAA